MKVLLPGVKLARERSEVDAFELCAEGFELCATLIEKRTEAGGIAARVMMERRRHLDEAMQERFTVAGGFEPNGL